MNPVRRARIQLLFALVVIGVCASFIADSFYYPLSTREPLGAAFVPRWVAVITLLLAAGMAAQSRAELRVAKNRAREDEAAVPDTAYRRHFIGTVGVMAAYAVLLKWPPVPSIVSTPLFLFIFILLLGGRSKKTLAWATSIGLVLGISLQILFRDVLYVNLP